MDASGLDVSIVGVGEADGGKATGRAGVDLGAEATLRAIDDAGLTLDQIDALLVEAPDVDQHHMAHLALADVLDWQPSVALSTGAGGATPFANVILASALIRSGTAQRILVVDYDARHTLREPEKSARMARRAGHRSPWEDAYGPITAAKFALVARSHMAAYGTTRRQLAAITVTARENGARRESAQLQSKVTIEDVLESPPIAEPLHLLDCCVVSDWGSAIVVAKSDPHDERAVDLIGSGQAHQGYAISRGGDLTSFEAIARSGEAAFAMAGITPKDVDVALIYDSFTIAVLVALENLGFCEVGRGGPFVASGAIAVDGELPVNPHGGQLSYSGGHGHFIAEGVRQLRNEAPTGQIRAARLALCQGTAAGVLSSYTLILRGRA